MAGNAKNLQFHLPTKTYTLLDRPQLTRDYYSPLSAVKTEVIYGITV